jgi:outer membrane protein W
VKTIPSLRLRQVTGAFAAAAAALIVTCAHADSLEGPWERGATWTTFRAGYAKSLEGGAPNAMAGIGFGFSHMLSDRVSVGVFIHYELLGKYGAAAQIEMPITAEYAYALKWNTALRPYVGIGLGAFYHKIYRTGADRTDLLPATIFKFGADTPLDEHNVLGIDARVARVADDDETVDPVFGKPKATSARWSVKLCYSRVF